MEHEMLRAEEPASGPPAGTSSGASARPRRQARLAGLFYVLEGGTSAFGAIYVTSKLTVTGNASATASNVLAHQPLLWLGFAAALIAVACHVVYTVLFYQLLRPVNRTIAMTGAGISLVACAVQGMACLLEVAPLLILRGGRYLSAFKPGQLHALALLFLKLESQAYDIYLVFFGLWLVITACLLASGRLVPRIVGVLAALAGACYLVLLSPSLASYLSPYYLAPDAVGEPVLMLWLLIVGVDASAWNAKASRVPSALR